MSQITDPETSRLLPNVFSLQRSVQRSRADATGSAEYNETKARADFVLPDSCNVTQRNKQFLLYDQSNGTDRILVFATTRNLEKLADHRTWLCDGTFYVAPKLFYQSYSVHALIAGKAIPLLYALLPDKKQATYNKLLEILADQCGTDAGIFIMDFEKAVINAVHSMFPNHDIRLCLFHLTQNVQKHIQETFKVKYRENSEFARAARLVIMLAFVPLNRLEDAIEAIMLHLQSNYPELMSIFTYFEKYYIGELVYDFDNESTYRTVPTYPPERWNFF